MAEKEISTELKSHFLRLYQIALCDEHFSKLEWKMLYKFGEERHVPKEEMDKLLLSPSEKLVIPNDLLMRLEYLYDFARMIWVDGKVTEEELETFKKYCRKFEIDIARIDDLTEHLIDCAKRGESKDKVISDLNL